jgi:hypothetical protein
MIKDRSIIYLICNLILLAALMVVIFSGCSYVPDLTARIELNACEIPTENNTDFFPYLEISTDKGDLKLKSNDLCFSFYVFSSDMDTLYSRTFKILGQNSFTIPNILK